MLLKGTDRFHQRALKVIADTHDLTGCLHLRRQCSLGADEFIKWQTREFDYNIVEHRFKAGICLLGDRILDLIQRVAQRDLCRYLCDGIPRCLGCQSRRTAHSGIYLDHTVFKCVRVQCVLYVTSTCDIQFADNIQCGSTEHLILLVAQCL